MACRTEATISRFILTESSILRISSWFSVFKRNYYLYSILSRIPPIFCATYGYFFSLRRNTRSSKSWIHKIWSLDDPSFFRSLALFWISSMNLSNCSMYLSIESNSSSLLKKWRRPTTCYTLGKSSKSSVFNLPYSFANSRNKFSAIYLTPAISFSIHDYNFSYIS